MVSFQFRGYLVVIALVLWYVLEHTPAGRYMHATGDGPDAARLAALFRRQAARQDRDEDEVVDAEDDLEERQRRERDPGLGRGDPIHGGRR